MYDIRIANGAKEVALEDKPLAAKGLISYRYPGVFVKYVMIGAESHIDALIQANRSLENPNARLELLEVWSNKEGRYINVANVV
jgi:hypothetical protein